MEKATEHAKMPVKHSTYLTISKDIAYFIKLPNCQFGEGLLRLGPLNVFHGVDCEDAGCDEKPGDLQSPRIIHDRFSLAMFS